MDAEELFPPRPGGMVDTARKAAQNAADAASTRDDTEVEDQGYAAVRVVPEEPQIGAARTVTLSSANPYLRLLARDTKRRSALVLAVDNDVYLTSTQGLAFDVQGSSSATQAFYLPAGIAIPVSNQDELWVSATTTATSSRVSVLVSLDGAR